MCVHSLHRANVFVTGNANPYHPREQIVENMKALEVVPLLTPEVLEKIEAVVQSKPKRLESYR